MKNPDQIMKDMIKLFHGEYEENVTYAMRKLLVATVAESLKGFSDTARERFLRHYFWEMKCEANAILCAEDASESVSVAINKVKNAQ